MPRTARPAPAAPETPAESTDLRRHRSVTTRKKITEALLALLAEGVTRPTAEQVAARADVGLRTVFRHFDDMPTLHREVIHVIDGLVDEVVSQPLVGATWRERVLASVAPLAAHYEKLAAYYLATQVLRRESAYIDEQARRYAAMQREMLHRTVPRELYSDVPRFAALSLALSMDAWVHLRRDQALAYDEAEKAVRVAVQAVIG